MNSLSTQRDLTGFAVLGMFFAMGSTAWIRGFGYVSFTTAAPIAGALAFAVAIGLGATLARLLPLDQIQATYGKTSCSLIRLFVGGVVAVISTVLCTGEIGKISAYGVSHGPNGLGLFLAMVGIAFAIAGCRKGDGSILIGSLTIALASYVVVTAFLWDWRGNSPHAVVRSFAAAAYLKDQEEMNKFYTKQVLSELSDLPVTVSNPSEVQAGGGIVTVSPFYGVGAKNAVIFRIVVTGDTAEVDCPVPHSGADWGMSQIRASMFTIYLLREDGEWKIDVTRSIRERKALFDRAFDDSSDKPDSP